MSRILTTYNAPMATFPFRETRIESNIPIWLSLSQKNSIKERLEKVEATVINVSKGGACILTPKLLVEGTHLFFSTLNSDNSLLLQPYDVPDTLEDFSLSARSVWMDSCQHLEKQVFMMGVCFLSPQKQFFDAVKKCMHS